MKRTTTLLATLAVGVAMSAASLAMAEGGVIKGKVIFKGEAPKRVVLDTKKDPNCAKSIAKIGSYDVIVNKKTDPPTLRNVIVSIKDGLGSQTFKAPATPVKLEQHGCQYEPHIVAMMEGQDLQILNGDDTNHNIHFLPQKNEEINFSQPKKDLENGKTVKLVKEEPFKIKCDVHPWMGAHIAVFNHPFFAVTGDEGTFELKDVPPGEYVIEAWHETYGSQTMNVKVESPGSTVEKDFTFEAK